MISMRDEAGTVSAVPACGDQAPLRKLTSSGGANSAGANGGGGANPSDGGASRGDGGANPNVAGANPNGGRGASRDDVRAHSHTHGAPVRV